MLTTLLVAALSLQDTQLGTVDVGGQSVSVTVPATSGPFSDATPHVILNDWKYALTPGGNLGTRYKSDGGWREVAENYPAAAVKAASAPEYRVRVFLFKNTAILEEGRDGIWRERRGTLNDGSLAQINAALARFKALAETAAEGGVRVTFDVSMDEDTLFRVSRAGAVMAPTGRVSQMTVDSVAMTGELLGPAFIHEEIATRINNDAFESEDRKYRGPYSSVFVVHPMRTADVTTYMIDRTPATSVSWSTFTDQKPSEALSILLFRAWIDHLAASAERSGRDAGASPVTSYGQLVFPNVYAEPVEDLLVAGNRLSQPGFSDRTSPGAFGTVAYNAGEPISKLPVATKEDLPQAENWTAPHDRRIAPLGEGRVLVHPITLERFLRIHQGARALGRVRPVNGGWDWVAVQVGGSLNSNSDLAALQIQPDSLPALPITSPGPEEGEIALRPVGIGEFETTVADGTVRIQENGADRRGYAVLATADPGRALFRATNDNGIRLRILSELNDSYVLQLVSRDGSLHNIPMYGDWIVPPEVGDAPLIAVSGPLQPSREWSDFGASLAPVARQDIVEVRLAPAPYASFYERVSDGGKPVLVSSLGVGSVTPTAPKAQPVDADLAWVKSLKAPLDAAAVSKMKLILAAQSSSLKLNALAAMNWIKHPDLIPDIAPSTSSASAGEAFLAINALKLQDDDRAWSQIAFAAIRGPLGHTYAFAAAALASKKEDVTLELLGVPLLARNHHARREAVRSINAIESEQAAVVASTAISNGDPDPTVRLEIVRKERPQSDLFARRVLWTAVNDESEWVRAQAYLSLLDSPFEDVRDQALRGVRDESVAIRLAILRRMAAKPQDHYRSALRIAVIDAVPLVRAAALDAFAAQSGEVSLAEVQNTVNDQSPTVQAALRRLAEKKGLTIPPMS